MSYFVSNFTESANIINRIREDKSFLDVLNNSIKCLSDAVKSNNLIMSCGNGGSMCDAMHFAEELTGRFKKDRRPIKALSFSDPAHMSCVSNDFGYQDIFSRMVDSFGQENDVVIGISTSGNSENVIRAFEVAKTKKIKTIGLLGKDGGKIKDMVDFPLIVPSHTTERIQEVHIKIIHCFIEGIEREIFPDHYSH